MPLSRGPAHRASSHERAHGRVDLHDSVQVKSARARIIGLVLWQWLLPVLASATHPGLVVDADPCLELDEQQLRVTIELRLGAGPDYHQGAARRDDTQLLLDCGAEGRAELTIIDPLTNSTTTRSLALPTDRRTERLAWAAAALLRATWMNIDLDPSTRAHEPSARQAARVARRPPVAWHLGDGFAVRHFFSRQSPSIMLGEQVEVLHRPLRHLAWKADAELSYWRMPVELDGETGRINPLAVSVAPSLLGWGEIPGRGRRGAGTVSIYGGAGFRIGGMRMFGGETFGKSKFELFAGPLATARLGVSLGRHVGLALNAEAGWILHGPERPNDVPMSFVGPWTNGVLVIVSSF